MVCGGVNSFENYVIFWCNIISEVFRGMGLIYCCELNSLYLYGKVLYGEFV